MDVEDSFKGDPRNKFKRFFQPLVEGTNYYFEESKDGKILALKKVGQGSRVLGFQARVAGENKGMMYTFYDRYVYEMLNKKIGLPPNQKKDDKKKQPHVYIPLEKLWNCVCVLTEKNDQMV